MAKANADLRDRIRDRLRAIATQAAQAQRMPVNSDTLCDLVDDIDNDLQSVITLVNKARTGRANGGNE